MTEKIICECGMKIKGTSKKHCESNLKIHKKSKTHKMIMKNRIEDLKVEIMRAKENRMFGIVEQLEREFKELKNEKTK